MGFKSFFTKLFGEKTEEVKPTVVQSPIVRTEPVVETLKVEAPVETSPTKIIEERLAEVASKVEEKKVTAKDIKSKVKRAPENKLSQAPQKKAPTQKQPQKQNPPRKKPQGNNPEAKKN